jgi:hypothetical protein
MADSGNKGAGKQHFGLPKHSPRAAAAKASANASTGSSSTKGGGSSNGSVTGPPLTKVRRTGGGSDVAVIDADVEAEENAPGAATPISPDFEAMFASLMQSAEANNHSSLLLSNKVDSLISNVAHMQKDTDSKFIEVHALIAAQGNRVDMLASNSPLAAAVSADDPALADMKDKIDNLEVLVKSLKVVPPAGDPWASFVPGAAAASSSAGAVPSGGRPPAHVDQHRPNAIWIKGLSNNVDSRLLNSFAKQVIALFPANLDAKPVPDIRGFGKQFLLKVKDADTARILIEHFHEHPIEVRHPNSDHVVYLKASRDLSLDLRLKNRLLGSLWKKVVEIKGESFKLSNSRGALWALEPSGEVFELFAAVADCSGAAPTMSIIPNDRNLEHYLLTPAIYGQWILDAVGEVMASTSVSRFRSGR